MQQQRRPLPLTWLRSGRAHSRERRRASRARRNRPPDKHKVSSLTIRTKSPHSIHLATCRNVTRPTVAADEPNHPRLARTSRSMDTSRTVEVHEVAFGRSEFRWVEEVFRRFESVSVPQIIAWSMRSPAIKLRIRTPFSDRHDRLSYRPRYPNMSDTRRARASAPVAKLKLPERLPPPP